MIRLALILLCVACSAFGIGLSGSKLAENTTVQGIIVDYNNVRYYGAVGNGVADDSAAFQAALNAIDARGGGQLFIPNGNYIIGTGLKVGATNGQHFISIRGESTQAKLFYNGSSSGVALTLLSCKNTAIIDLTIERSGSRGTTIGILMTGQSSGTQSNGGYMRNIQMLGFHVCISAGPESPYSGTSSEWTFDNMTFQSSDIGFVNIDFNGLNFLFRQLQAANMETVVKGETAGIIIDGGSWSNCGTGFYCRNGGLYAIRNVRAEVQTNYFVNSVSSMIIENCMVQGATGDGTNKCIVFGGNINARITSCFIGGRIIGNDMAALTIQDTGVWDTQVARATNVQSLIYVNNYQTADSASPLGRFPDNISVSGNGLLSSYNINATNGYSAAGIAGITTIWTNMIPNVITQRISTIGGIVVTNLTL